jgi:ribosomal protein S12 methylthiotransferase
VVPYVDMPLQHIAQDMLRAMGRAMTERQTRALVTRIRAGIPGVAFRTNFIVGFPGETDAHFDTLVRYVEEEPFDNLVVFGYEREPETPSHAMTPRVAYVTRRWLLARQQQLSRERLAGRIGETVTVMIDGPAPGGTGRWAARTAGSAWEVDGGVLVEGGPYVPGQLATVRVTGAAAYDLFARAERSSDPALTILGT